MSKEEKMLSAFANILYIKEGIRVNPTQLKSTRADEILSEEILAIIDKYEPYFSKIEEIVEFIDNVKNPTGINKFVRNYAHSHGTQHTKTVDFINNKTGEITKKEIDDYYVADDPEEYVMILIDHIGLIGTETINGRKLSLHECIVKLSSDYLITLRNKYNYIPVVIQQQASSQESVENMKNNRLKPTLDGLGDCKLTQRDANVVLGLFSPFRHEIPMYYNYDITRFRDNIRFLEILASREGGGGTVAPLYFDGAVNYFKELPKPDNPTGMQAVYKILDKIRE